MTILTNSDRPAIKSFCEFIIEQNNGRAEADEQTLYDVAYLLFYERGAIKHENERVLKGNSVLNKRLAELEKQNAELKEGIGYFYDELAKSAVKIQSLLADKMILKSENERLHSRIKELIEINDELQDELSERGLEIENLNEELTQRRDA
jgi:hypothetical protein|nr:MAG TPA: nucleoprotein [Caudoviricetes sp.]